MRPEEQRIRFKEIPDIGGRIVYVPRPRGGRPEKIFEDKTKYRREREKQRLREMMPVANLMRKIVAKTM